MDKEYSWNRFWIRQGDQAILTDGGYLVDPEQHKAVNPFSKSWTEISSIPCLILLGEPGSGKSVAVERAGLTSDAPTRLFLNLCGYSDQTLLHSRLFNSRQFTEWLNSTETLELVLDSLDECLIHIKTVAAWLADEFRKYPVSRLRLRVVCRTAEWPDLLREELPRIWKSDEIAYYELAPLRRIDVMEAARCNGIDGKEFDREVEKSGVTGLAINPITLKFLLREFKPQQGLPRDPVELYRRGCLRLCGEWNPSRNESGAVPKQSIAELLSTAERIAAITMFSRRASVLIPENVPGW